MHSHDMCVVCPFFLLVVLVLVDVAKTRTTHTRTRARRDVLNSVGETRVWRSCIVRTSSLRVRGLTRCGGDARSIAAALESKLKLGLIEFIRARTSRRGKSTLSRCAAAPAPSATVHAHTHTPTDAHTHTHMHSVCYNIECVMCSITRLRCAYSVGDMRTQWCYCLCTELCRCIRELHMRGMEMNECMRRINVCLCGCVFACVYTLL